MLPFKHYKNVITEDLFESVLKESKPTYDSFTNNSFECNELRATTWMSDNLNTTLEYSNKVMKPINLTPTILKIRETLYDKFNIYFDSVLVNYYPNGNVGMRYHSDPIEHKWDTNFIIMSFGGSRKLIFREIKDINTKYSFDMNNGDCIHMFNDCQDLYQHSVRKQKNSLPRISLVFKKHYKSPVNLTEDTF